MTVRVELLDEPALVDTDQWEALASTSICGALYSGPRWCRAANEDDGIGQRYLVARDAGRLVGLAPVDLMPPGVPISYDVQRLLEMDRGPDVPAWSCPVPLMPCLTATTRAGNATDVRVARHLDHRERRAVVGAMVEHLLGEAGRLGARSVAFLRVPAYAASVRSVLEAGGMTGATIGAAAYLPLDFADLDGYAGTFGWKRRRRVRRDLRLGRDAPLEFTLQPLASAIDLHCVHVGHNVAKYGEGFDGRRLAQRLRTITAQFGGDATLIAMSWQGRTIGTLDVLKDGDRLCLRALGIVPDAPPQLAAYFNLVYRAIQLGLDMGCRHVVAGSELLDVKAAHGFAIERSLLYVTATDEAVVRRLRDLARCLSGPFADLESRRRMRMTRVLEADRDQLF